MSRVHRSGGTARGKTAAKPGPLPTPAELLDTQDPALAYINDEQVLELFPKGKQVWVGNELDSSRSPNPQWRAAIFDVLARAKVLGVDVRLPAVKLKTYAAQAEPGAVQGALTNLATALGRLDQLPWGDGVNHSAPAPSPAQIEKDTREQHAIADAQAAGQDSVFSVCDVALTELPVVKELLSGSRVGVSDLGRLSAAGISWADIDEQLVQNGDGPLAELLTGEAMAVLLRNLPDGHTDLFLSTASRTLPDNMSIKQCEQELAARSPDAHPPEVQELVNQGYTPQGALRAVVTQLKASRSRQPELTPRPGGSPVAPSFTPPSGENAELSALVRRSPALGRLLNNTLGRPVNGADMQEMIDAVGPSGLKALGTSVVFGSGGISDRILPEAIDVFLKAVNMRSGGAAAGGVPAQAYARQSAYTGPASSAATPQAFAQDPALRYLAASYPNGWGAYPGSAALSLTAPNLMNYGNNFVYGRMLDPPLWGPYSNALYTGQVPYAGGIYSGTGYWGQPVASTPPTVGPQRKRGFWQRAGEGLAAVATGAAIGLSWGLGWGGYYGYGGCWGLGAAYWGAYPCNWLGYNMLYSGWPWAMSLW
jgi:hypothetical protein